MKTLAIALIALSCLACAGSIYNRQAALLEQAYNSGQISASEYTARMNDLTVARTQHHTAMSQAIMNYSATAFRPVQVQPIQAPAPVYRQPAYGSGTIMGPGGQTYYYWGSQY